MWKNKLLSETLAKDKTIKVRNLDKDKIQIIYPAGYEMDKEVGDQGLKQEIALQLFSENKNNINLFRVNPEIISRIYCGYRCDADEVKEFACSNSQLACKNEAYKKAESKHRIYPKKEIWYHYAFKDQGIKIEYHDNTFKKKIKFMKNSNWKNGKRNFGKPQHCLIQQIPIFRRSGKMAVN